MRLNADTSIEGYSLKNGDSNSGNSMKVDNAEVGSATIQFSDNLIGTLHFYDKSNMQIAVKSMDWALSMWELDQELRNRIKYSDGLSGEVAGLEWAREQLHEQLGIHGVSLEDIE